MDIYTSLTYKVDGKEFSTLPDVKTHIENEIGLLFDGIQPRLPPEQALQVLAVVINNRERLVELLSAKYKPESEEIPCLDISIFNL